MGGGKVISLQVPVGLLIFGPNCTRAIIITFLLPGIYKRYKCLYVFCILNINLLLLYMTATFHYICLHISVVVEIALSHFRNFQQWEGDHTLSTSLLLGATSYRDICVAS